MSTDEATTPGESAEAAPCDCGHVEAAHEDAVRVGKAWFTVDLAEERGEEGDVWHYCGHCEDGCYVVGTLPRSDRSVRP